MDRRVFLRFLAGAAATVVAPKVYVFAPPGGWGLDNVMARFRREMAYAMQIPEYMIFGPTIDAQRRVKQYLTLAEVERDFGSFLEARLETVDPVLVKRLRAECDEKWFL